MSNLPATRSDTATAEKGFAALVCHAFILCPLFSSLVFSNEVFPDQLNAFFLGWRMVSYGTMCLVMLVNYRAAAQGWVTKLLLLLFVILWTTTTALQGGATGEALKSSLNWLFTFLSIATLYSINPRACTNALRWVLLIYIALNALSIIMFPGALFLSSTGMKNWLLGDRNLFIMYILPGLVASLLYDVAFLGKRFSFFTALLFVLSAFELLWVKSSTSLVALGVFALIGSISTLWPRLYSKLNIKVMTLVVVIVFLSFVVFRIQDVFSWFIVDFLGKTSSVSDRVVIWDYVINRIRESPFVGYGQQNVIAMLSGLDGGSSFAFAHAHDFYLNVAYVCGLGGIVLLAAWYCLCVESLYDDRGNRSAFIVALGLSCLLLVFVFEYTAYPSLFALGAIAEQLKYARPCRSKEIGSKPSRVGFGEPEDKAVQS